MEATIKTINAICLEVCGEPVGKGRPRFSFKSGHAYTPAKTREYEDRIKSAFLESEQKGFPAGVPLSISLIFGFKIPNSASKKTREKMINCDILPMKKPDVDNVLKAVMDALNGLAYDDDKQIVKVWVFKKYSEVPRTTILIQEVLNGEG